MSVPSTDSAAIKQVIKVLVAAGHTLSHVDYGDGEPVTHVLSPAEAVEEVLAVDDAYLYFNINGGIMSSQGWVRFVPQGDVEDLVADYTLSLDPHIKDLIRTWMV